MFNIFKKRKQQKEILIEEISINENQLQLTAEEISEIDTLITSLQVAHDELIERMNEISLEDSTVISNDDVLNDESFEQMEFIREGLNNVMRNFIELQQKKVKEKVDNLVDRILIWKTMRKKIDSHMRIEMGELILSDDSLPISLLLAKVSKTINDNPDLLTEIQVNKIKDTVNSIMTEAFNS